MSSHNNSSELPPRLKRVLFVINACADDAPTNLTMNLAQQLLRSGWHCKVVAWSRSGPLKHKLKEMGLEPVSLGNNPITRTINLAKNIREFQPAIVHSILVRPTLGVYGTKPLSRCDFAWIAGDHGIHEWDQGSRATSIAMQRIMPGVLSSADAVVTVSNAASKDLTRAGVRREALHVIPNGVDPTRFYPRGRAQRCSLVANLFPSDDPWEIWPLIGTAGNLLPLKGHADLLRALPGVLAQWPAARLVIWGDGPQRPHLEQLARQLSISHAIAMPSFEPSLEQRFPLLDLYVQPSHVESFGLAAAEAMCCGVPAILSSAGGLPELADNGRAAWLYPAGNIDALRDTLLDALYNKQRLRLRGDTGRGWILKNYTIVRFVKAMTTLYQQTLADKGLIRHV